MALTLKTLIWLDHLVDCFFLLSLLQMDFINRKIPKDKELMLELNVHHIFDLMVEDAKVKYYMT